MSEAIRLAQSKDPYPAWAASSLAGRFYDCFGGLLISPIVLTTSQPPL
jgi:hypothetical protein